MAKKKGGAKKSTAKKAAAPEVEAVEEKVETPIEGTNEGSGDYDPELPTSPGPEVKQELAQEPDLTPEEEPEASLPLEDNSPAALPPGALAPPVVEHKEVLVNEETWKDRVLAEAKELRIKMDALRAALDGYKVPATEVDILNKQYKAMHEYYVILNTRLSR